MDVPARDAPVRDAGGTPGALPSRHEADARRRFDDWSRSQTFRRLGPWLAFVQESVLDRMDWPRLTRVLDVACGSGWAVQEASRRLSGRHGALACGCDISNGMLRVRDRGAPGAERARFAAASAQALPFRSGAFDVILCTAAFHHFPRPVEALREMRRVLRPGGEVLITDSCRDMSVATWIWDRIHRLFEKGHVKYYRRDELHALMVQAGFESVEAIDFRPTFARTGKIASRVALFRAATPN